MCLLVQEGEQAEHGDSALRLELQQLQARRMLRTLAVVQDLADALLALNDVRRPVQLLVIFASSACRLSRTALGVRARRHGQPVQPHAAVPGGAARYGICKHCTQAIRPVNPGRCC